ncbi:hypothetical protein FY528_03260 [Hymenobacter lutimineralis]|uniref:Uncharacterized protein n=1 Tax=Hymenobacter lutimineralis TaxID=2606448 RepID=A0A5D6VDI4_9BACT|nr:polysaccharide biosynthesis C-terminal domain-containing protein [Hymenobacter lutimineralis]TYZ13440.1 hypothetical protein FY528_03260 [Hymenobacter lutimineralis]
MIRRFLHNFFTRLSTAILSFGVVWLTARYLGAAGRGAVSLFVTDTAALLLFTGLLGGSSLIYLAPRRNVWHLLLPAYVWAMLVCTFGVTVVAGLRQPPLAYLGHLAGISLLQAFFSINTLLLLGRRREKAYNLLSVLQVLLLAGLLWGAFSARAAWISIDTYYAVSYLSYGLPWGLSFWWLLRLPDRREQSRRLRAVTRELARHSRGAHLSNILGFANYRLSYYFVAHFADARALGILSVGVALAEAIWLIPRSTALLQYVDLVNAPDGSHFPPAAQRAARLTLLATVGALLVLASLPTAFITEVFGPEFGPARGVILLLAPGVLAAAVQMLISSYFAGLARYAVNNFAALLGLIVTLLGCTLLIPRFGIRGAALASTFSYLASTGLLLWRFRQATDAGPGAFLPRVADLSAGWNLLRQRLR